jgi:hypothetical protein
MRFLRRRRVTAQPGQGHEALGVSAVRFLDATDARGDDVAARAALREIVDEAVLLQGLTEDILDGVREGRSRTELAPPGGALIARFAALRAAVPEPVDPRLRAAAATLRETLDHHALMLSSSLDLLGDLEPERAAARLDTFDGLGTPARRLCALQDALRGGP